MSKLFTFDELKALADWKKTEVDFPALPALMDSVKARIIDYLKVSSLDKVTNKKETFRNYNSSMIPLSVLPVISVQSVIVDGNTEYPFAENDDFEISDYGIRLLDFVPAKQKLEITYTAGYETVSDVLQVSESIKRAALLQTLFEYQNRNQLASETITTDAGTIRKPGLKFLREVEETLKPHRHPYYSMPLIII